MSAATSKLPRVRRVPDSSGVIAQLFPEQGDWSEDEYLALDTNRRVEFSDGFLELLPLPTTSHERIVKFLFLLLHAFVEVRGLGEVFCAGIRVRLRPGKIRMADVLFMSAEHEERMGEQCWEGVDLAMEVVSEDRKRDLVTKREEYALARIREYWIVDPKKERITVLRLSRGRYVTHGEFVKGMQATSALLKGFSVDVTEAFQAQRKKRK